MTLVMSWPMRDSCGCAPKKGDTAIGMGCTWPLVMSMRTCACAMPGSVATAIAAAPPPITPRREKTGVENALVFSFIFLSLRFWLTAATDRPQHVARGESEIEVAARHLRGLARRQRQWR